MNVKKILVAAVLTCSLALNSATVLAAEITSWHTTASTPEIAGKYLQDLMEFLMDNYKGDPVTAEQLYEAAAVGMVAPLDDFTEYLAADAYTNLYNSVSGNFKGIGIQFSTALDGSFVVQKAYNHSPAQTAGVQKGDIILSVNGTAVSGYSTEYLNRVIGAVNGEVLLEIKRAGVIKTYTMEKAEIQMPTVEYGFLGDYLPQAKNNQRLAYIKISQVGERTAVEMAEAIAHMQSYDISGLVIDLRGNPGGIKNVIEDISRMLVPKGVIYSTIDSHGNKVSYRSELERVPFQKVAILVDGGTASAAELFASAMQDAAAATIIGQTTYGKGIIQSFAALETGDFLKYTSMEYLRRNGGKLNLIGITPDIVLPRPSQIGDNIFIMNNDGTGEAIPALKELLSFIGYKIDNLSAVYDAQTQTAVKDIQKRAKLNQTGQLDSQTVKAINIALTIYLTENDAELAKAYEILK